MIQINKTNFSNEELIKNDFPKYIRKHNIKIDKEAQNSLIKIMQEENDPTAKEKLFNALLPLFFQLANNYKTADALSELYIIFNTCVYTFNPSKNMSFINYFISAARTLHDVMKVNNGDGVMQNSLLVAKRSKGDNSAKRREHATNYRPSTSLNTLNKDETDSLESLLLSRHINTSENKKVSEKGLYELINLMMDEFKLAEIYRDFAVGWLISGLKLKIIAEMYGFTSQNLQYKKNKLKRHLMELIKKYPQTTMSMYKNEELFNVPKSR